MPKTNLIKDPYRDLRVLLAGTASIDGRKADDIALAMGVSPRSVYRYLDTPGTLSLDKLRRLARHLNIPIEQFRQSLHY